MSPLPDGINEEQIIIIGKKPDFVKLADGTEIKTEPYLRPIMDRLTRFHQVWIKTIPSPEKLGKIQEMFEILKHYGIVEVKNRKIMTEPHKTNPDKKFEYMFICWENHPKLVVYREIEIYRKLKG